MPRKQPIKVIGLEDIPEIWGNLIPEQKIYLKNHSSLQHFKKNTLIHQEGEIPTHMMILVRGKVKIYKTGVGGRDQIMRMLKPNEFFGYRAIFALNNYHGYNTNARAFEDCSIYMIPASVIETILIQNAPLAFEFIKRLAADLGASDARIVTLTQKHIRGRLADTLLFLRENFGMAEDGQTLGVSLSRDDIAGLSNMTTSNAIRTLSNFATEGLIKLEGRRIRLLQLDEITKISHLG